MVPVGFQGAARGSPRSGVGSFIPRRGVARFDAGRDSAENRGPDTCGTSTADTAPWFRCRPDLSGLRMPDAAIEKLRSAHAQGRGCHGDAG
jgi:hypothetical protein